MGVGLRAYLREVLLNNVAFAGVHNVQRSTFQHPTTLTLFVQFLAVLLLDRPAARELKLCSIEQGAQA